MNFNLKLIDEKEKRITVRSLIIRGYQSIKSVTILIETEVI